MSGDAVHVNVRGAAQDVPVRLVRSCVTMDATYVTMSSQKLVTIANRSDVIARYRWTRFATAEAERQHRARSDLHYQRFYLLLQLMMTMIDTLKGVYSSS